MRYFSGNWPTLKNSNHLIIKLLYFYRVPKQLPLKNNQLLLCDEKGDFISKNKFIDDSSLNMIIADKRNSVLKMGHPEKLLKFYTSL